MKSHFNYLLETTLGALFILSFGYFFHPENLIFSQITPHPFVILTLFLAVRYGLSAGFFSALFLGALFLGLGTFQNVLPGKITDFVNMAVPLQMLILASLIGEIREQQIQKYLWKASEYNKLQKKFQDIQKSYQSLDTVRNELEKRIVEEKTTIYSLYQLFENVKKEKLSHGLEEILEFLKDHLSAKRLALYVKDRGEYLLIRQMGCPSLPILLDEEFRFYHPLLKACEQTKKLVSIHELKEEDFNIDLDYPLEAEAKEFLFCAPLLNVENQVLGYLLIGDLPFLNFYHKSQHLILLLTTWMTHFLEIEQKLRNLKQN